MQYMYNTNKYRKAKQVKKLSTACIVHAYQSKKKQSICAVTYRYSDAVI